MTARPIEILLVEDSPTDRFLAEETLAQAKLVNRLHVVTDGVDALDFLRRTGAFSDAPRPDLILLDLNLPGKDGREVLAEIRADASLSSIPVVALIPCASDEAVLKSGGLHANCYMTKPVEFAKLMRLVGEMAGLGFAVVALPTTTNGMARR